MQGDEYRPWVAEIRDFQEFPIFLIFVESDPQAIRSTFAPLRLEVEQAAVSIASPGCRGSRFPARTHALDSLEYISNRFGDFYFSMKINIFGILENP